MASSPLSKGSQTGERPRVQGRGRELDLTHHKPNSLTASPEASSGRVLNRHHGNRGEGSSHSRALGGLSQGPQVLTMS